MIPLQILSILFGLIMLYIVTLHRRKKHLDRNESIIWIILWIGFIYVAIFPNTFKGVIQTLHIARVFDLLVILALMVIVLMVFNNRLKVKELEQRLEELVRKRTLEK